MKLFHNLTSILGTALLLIACGIGGTDSSVEPESGRSPSTVSEESDETREPNTADPTSEERAGWGEPLESPERYYGVYGSNDQPNRDFFVAEAKRPVWAERAPEVPPGHIMIGAMWGDVAPWYMRTVSPTRFEQRVHGNFGPSEPFVVEFELNEEGQAVAMEFIIGFEDRGRLQRKGDLPEGW